MLYALFEYLSFRLLPYLAKLQGMRGNHMVSAAQWIDQRSQNWNVGRNCEKKQKQKHTANCKTS